MKVAQVACFVVCIAVCTAQGWSSQYSCRAIVRSDCYQFGNHPECGTNGVTYRNRCDYSKAHCADRNIHVAYDGVCSTTTTMAPSGTTSGTGTGTGGGTGPIISGPEAVFDFFCLELSHHPCDTDLETICASNGVTYINTCEFEKHRCTHREITIAKFEKC
ncbi:agrin-like [Mytilus californianus]|uniref:agrin-like n=1 Tax=Mytilus californianus TaxID=6549 RepID=UPI002246AF4F|nr:agrin-like [Mytilus californianus]